MAEQPKTRKPGKPTKKRNGESYRVEIKLSYGDTTKSGIRDPVVGVVSKFLNGKGKALACSVYVTQKGKVVSKISLVKTSEIKDLEKLLNEHFSPKEEGEKKTREIRLFSDKEKKKELPISLYTSVRKGDEGYTLKFSVAQKGGLKKKKSAPKKNAPKKPAEKLARIKSLVDQVTRKVYYYSGEQGRKVAIEEQNKQLETLKEKYWKRYEQLKTGKTKSETFKELENRVRESVKDLKKSRELKAALKKWYLADDQKIKDKLKSEYVAKYSQTHKVEGESFDAVLNKKIEKLKKELEREKSSGEAKELEDNIDNSLLEKWLSYLSKSTEVLSAPSKSRNTREKETASQFYF